MLRQHAARRPDPRTRNLVKPPAACVFSWQVAKVNDGKCDRVVGTYTAQSRPSASILTLVRGCLF